MEEEQMLPVEEGSEEEDELDDISDFKPANDEEAVNIFERTCSKFTEYTEEDPTQTNFADGYAKLLNYLRKTRERSSELEENREDLADALEFSEERLKEGLKLIEDDGGRIENLKDEISTSQKLVDNAQAREKAAQEVIDSLRKTIASLNYEIDVKNKMAQVELEENPAAAKHREILEREKTKLISEVSKLSEKLNNALAYQEELERRTSFTDMRINDISTQLEETQAEVSKFKRNKEKLESDIADYTDEMVKKSADVDTLRSQMNVNQKMIHRYQAQLKQQTQAAQKCFKELDLWNKKYTKMQNEYVLLGQQAEEIKHDNYAAIKELRTKDDQKVRLQIEVNKLLKEREQADHRARMIETDKMEMLEDKKKLIDAVATMQRDCELQKQEAAANKTLIDEHLKEKDILNRNLLRQQAVARDQQKVIKIHEQTKKHLDHEIDEHVIETRRQAKQILYLETERDRLMEDALEKSKRMEDTKDEIGRQNQHLDTLRHQLAANEAKAKLKQQLLDAVRTDKNALQKEMEQSTAENNDIKEKLKINHKQSEQMKEGIGAREVELIKEETIRRKIVKEKDNVKIELNNTLDMVRSLKERIAAAVVEEKRLQKVIEESEKLMEEQVKSITNLIRERDVLGSQVVRRNDEISLVLEKIALIRSTLYTGEAQYEARLDDIRLLKVEIKRLRQEAFLLKKSINNMNDFKVEVFHLERELTKERMKTKALEDELHNPMNVHRWRRLSGKDPEMTELLKKTSILQKRLLAQSVTQINVEKELKEVEMLYMNLRILISQQPGASVQEEFNKTQKALVDNTLKNEGLLTEINMLEWKTHESNKKITKAMLQVREVKKQLAYEEKMHANERMTLLESRKLIEHLKGAVDMPPIKNRGEGGEHQFPPISVSSMSMSKRRN